MFENLTEKLDGIFRKLKSRGRLDEENIRESLKEIRMALLEADVNFRVVKDFVEDVRSRAVGREVLESLTPGQQVVKIVHDRLVELMGGAGSQRLKLADRFPNLMAKDAEIAVKEIIDGLSAALARGDRVEIRGFGSFSLNYRPARVGRNPKTGETVHVPPKFAPHFKAGKEMRECIDRADKTRPLKMAA